MVEINISYYDILSTEEVTKRMSVMKRNFPIRGIETPNKGHFEIIGGRAVPLGLDYSPEIRYLGRNGEEGVMSFDEAIDILKRDHELRVDKYLESKGISRQDVKGFLEYLAASISLEKKIHPEVYEI